MAQVNLLDYTGMLGPDWLYAGRLLAYTKNTRMNLTQTGFREFMLKPEEEILAELKYMATSIPSSLEFVDVMFSVSGVSRAIAQQMTRTRTASYAMQSQRVNDMSDVKWDKRGFPFDPMMEQAINNYSNLVELGESLEDARNILPVGVHCNLLCKYNFRSFVELVRARDSLRVQAEYHDIVMQMKQEVIDVWPWAELFFVPKDHIAISLIEEAALEIGKLQGDQGAMYKGISGKLAKAADLLKK